MISISLLFMLFAGIVFLGYVLNALFYKLKVSNIIMLLLIGVAIGPLLHLVNTSPNSTIVQISPLVTAIALAFVLFDVGMNIKISSLASVFKSASAYTLLVSILTGAAATAMLYDFEGWGLLASLMIGFALSGTSSITLPLLFKAIRVSDNLKTTLAFQSVFNDIFSLVLPLIFFNILATGKYSLNFIIGEIGGFTLGSLILGVVFAAFWVFVLREFKQYSSEYSWMLTMTIVLAVYGTSQYLNFNGALSAFIFGILLTNIPDMKFLVKRVFKPVLEDISHIQLYQKEVTFFVSTFFFVYIGMLFTFQGLQYTIIALALGICVIMLLVRYVASGTLKGIISRDRHKGSDTLITRFYIAQGLAPAIVATLPATIGLSLPGMVNIVFMVLLISNAVLSIGLYLYANQREREGEEETKQGVQEAKSGSATKKT
ncbi:MAG: cation:proton antiporter [Candidatus Micrarchaeota archaeon]|nr:cation:proton antiporter [Candidatus Micrarchaeota archaeon]